MESPRIEKKEDMYIQKPSTTAQELRDSIDTDIPFQRFRKSLLVVSIVLLATSISGAKIEEANTFIFKISIENTDGFGYLLLSSIIFFLIRYYSCAKKYHEKISEHWVYRLISKKEIAEYYYDNEIQIYSDGCEEMFESLSGLAVKTWENYSGEKLILTEDPITVKRYIKKFPLKRYFEYSEGHHNDYTLNILKYGGLYNYIKILSVELSERIKSLLEHRENLDLLAPYFIAFCAIGAYLAKQYNFI